MPLLPIPLDFIVVRAIHAANGDWLPLTEQRGLPDDSRDRAIKKPFQKESSDLRQTEVLQMITFGHFRDGTVR
jgi:hypothetical protein